MMGEKTSECDMNGFSVSCQIFSFEKNINQYLLSGLGCSCPILCVCVSPLWPPPGSSSEPQLPLISWAGYFGAPPTASGRGMINGLSPPVVWCRVRSWRFFRGVCGLLLTSFSPCAQFCHVPREAVHSSGPGYPAVGPSPRRCLFFGFCLIYPPVGAL